MAFGFDFFPAVVWQRKQGRSKAGFADANATISSGVGFGAAAWWWPSWARTPAAAKVSARPIAAGYRAAILLRLSSWLPFTT
jgi:hypothetical protein